MDGLATLESPSHEDIAAFRDSVGQVLEKTCSSRALHNFIDGKCRIDIDIFGEAAELGWLSVSIPERLGGLEMGFAGLDPLFREIGRYTCPGALFPTLIGAQWLAETADKDIQQLILPDLSEGKVKLAIPIDLEFPQLSNDGCGHLTGNLAGYLGDADATHAIVPVECSDGDRACVVVRLDGEQTCFEPRSTWDITRSAGNVRCERAEVIGKVNDEEGSATAALRKCLYLAVAADSIGGAQEILARTVEYMKGRTQFGQIIASFQALKHRVADIKIAITAAQSLYEHALERSLRGDCDAEFWAGLAKVEACKAYTLAAEESVLLHGGVGYTVEYDCHIYLKRSLMNESIGGQAGGLCDMASLYLDEAAREGRSTAEIVW